MAELESPLGLRASSRPGSCSRTHMSHTRPSLGAHSGGRGRVWLAKWSSEAVRTDLVLAPRSFFFFLRFIYFYYI
jgi:hypothetical protein